MELLDIVDKQSNPTGETIERKKAHREGIRHRSSHVWLLRMRGERVEILGKGIAAYKEMTEVH